MCEDIGITITIGEISFMAATETIKAGRIFDISPRDLKSAVQISPLFKAFLPTLATLPHPKPTTLLQSFYQIHNLLSDF